MLLRCLIIALGKKPLEGHYFSSFSEILGTRN